MSLRKLAWHAYRYQIPTWYDGVRWTLDHKRWRSARRFRSLRGKHQGERCFIIGNGPSLNRTDLSYLRHETTFGLNRIYLLYPKIGFQTTYYVSVNRLVIEQCAADIARLPMLRFLSWHARDVTGFTPSMILLRSPRDRSLGFSTNPARRIWQGATVTFVAMQLAHFMGFQQVILVGVDHSFETKGTPHKVVISRGADVDHFSPEYFGEGFRWQLPDLDMSEKAYRLARDHFAKDGREILDATIGGKLEVFPKVGYETLF